MFLTVSQYPQGVIQNVRLLECEDITNNKLYNKLPI